MNKTTFWNIAAVALTAFIVSPAAHAQDIVWGAAQNITGDANLIDAGNTAGVTNVDAILPNGNLNNNNSGDPGLNTGASLTADGVTFNAAAFTSTSTSDGVITLAANSNTPVGGSAHAGTFSQYGGNFTFPTSGSSSAAFATLMEAGGIYGSDGTITIASSALTTGATYELQVFDYSNASQNESTVYTSANSVTLFDNNGTISNPATYLGQFATGTFTATGSNEVVDFSFGSGVFTPVVNAINLVELAVPEPSTDALLVSGVLVMLGFSLRRRQNLTA